MADAKKKDFEQEVADLMRGDVEITEPEESESQENETTSEIDELHTEIDALKAERDQFQDKFMRALADAENSRKRSDRDRREAEQYGGSRLARDLLPVYDNLKRALGAVSEEQKSHASALIEGVELTMRELLNIFSKHGITRVSPEVGDRFDPKLHEAMFEAPLPGTKAGDIIQVSTEGFMLHDRILRPAQVGVSSMVG